MFPFRWDYIKNPDKFDESSFEEKVNIDVITEYLLKSNWKIKSDEIESSEDYNEKLYFYDNVRRAIYNQNNISMPVVKNFVYIPNEKIRGQYLIQTKDREYILEIERIILKVYETGVAILSYHLKNSLYQKKEDIFMINDFGRRIYPQFIVNDEKKRTVTTKGSFLATKLQILWEDDHSPVTETFEWYDYLERVRQNPTKLSDTIMKLLGGSNYEECFIDNRRELMKNKILIRPIIDDRMFVICWYKNNDWVSELNKFNKNKNEYMYVEDEDWFKFVFVDGQDKCCTSKFMAENLLKQHTYDRWIETRGQDEQISYGTLFGITKYSFVMLCRDDWFSNNILLTHMRTMYYQIVSLVLAQRASILVFSDEVSSISTLKASNLVSRVRLLHKYYIQFINKLYFREVTAQEQGIELYTQLMNTCEIERNIKDLDNEISELHEYATLEQETQTNTVLNWLTIIGAAFVIPSFLTGFLGMNIIDDKLLLNKGWIKFFSVLKLLFYFYFVPIIGLLICYFCINKFRLKKDIKFSFEFFIIVLLFLMLPLIILILI